MENLNISVGKLQPEPNAPPMYPGLQHINLHPNNAYQSQQDMGMQHQPSANIHFQHTMPVESLKVPSVVRPETAVILVNRNASIAVGHEPVRITCPECGVKCRTRLDYHLTFRTHIIAMIFCATGFICCVPLPYCMKSCKKLDHYCSNCDQFIGNAIS